MQGIKQPGARRATITEGIRFIATGLANTLLTYAFYVLFLQVFDYRLAYFASFVVGLIFMSLSNIRFVFKRQIEARRVSFYAAYYVGYFLVNLFLIKLTVEQLGVAPLWAPALVLMVTVPVNFLLSRWIIKAT